MDTEQLLIFFVPSENSEGKNSSEYIADVAQSITRQCVQYHAIAVLHAIPLAPDEVPRGSLEKAMRKVLVKRYEGDVYASRLDALRKTKLQQRQTGLKPVGKIEEALQQIFSR